MPKKQTLTMKNIFLVLILIIAYFHSFSQDLNKVRKYIPANMEIYKEIVQMDSVFFSAYNKCDLKKQESIYSDEIEFFHDKSGLMTSKKEILNSTEKFICNKVTRKVHKETIEVYPINNYGAVEIGFHEFHNNQEPNRIPSPSKFIIIWHKVDALWKITKVISLH